MKNVKVYSGMLGSCVKVTGTSASPYVDAGTLYEGVCLMYPTIGMRFNCGTLSTNIVVEIIEENEDRTKGRYRTLSNSIYEWEITEKGEHTNDIEYDMPEHIKHAIKVFKHEDKN